MSHAAAAIPFWSRAEIDASIRATVEHLNAHGVLAYPTETVYGFGGAVDQESVRNLVALKSRPVGKPFLMLIAGVDMLARLDLHLTPAAASLAARFWPGPLTLVLPGGERRVPAELRGPEGGIAVRWTPHQGLLKLIRSYGDADHVDERQSTGHAARGFGRHDSERLVGRGRARQASRARTAVSSTRQRRPRL